MRVGQLGSSQISLERDFLITVNKGHNLSVLDGLLIQLIKFSHKITSLSMCEIKATGESKLNHSPATLPNILL